jgi:hypothetical protein
MSAQHSSRAALGGGTQHSSRAALGGGTEHSSRAAPWGGTEHSSRAALGGGTEHSSRAAPSGGTEQSSRTAPSGGTEHSDTERPDAAHPDFPRCHGAPSIKRRVTRCASGQLFKAHCIAQRDGRATDESLPSEGVRPPRPIGRQFMTTSCQPAKVNRFRLEPLDASRKSRCCHCHRYLPAINKMKS